MSPNCPLSIIIPTLNEAQVIEQSLQCLQRARSVGVELILADGGSADATVTMARPLVDTVVSARAGRARQMNAGAARARGEWLLFLHADTRLPDDFLAQTGQAMNMGRDWGFFKVHLSGRDALLRMVETTMNWRSALTGIATGDQCLFFRRELFTRLEGFPDIPLMEDIAMCKRLKSLALRPKRILSPVVTSSRRWERDGIVSTILLMFWLRFAYFVGFSPQRLQRQYYR